MTLPPRSQDGGEDYDKRVELSTGTSIQAHKALTSGELGKDTDDDDFGSRHPECR